MGLGDAMSSIKVYEDGVLLDPSEYTVISGPLATVRFNRAVVGKITIIPAPVYDPWRYGDLAAPAEGSDDLIFMYLGWNPQTSLHTVMLVRIGTVGSWRFGSLHTAKHEEIVPVDRTGMLLGNVKPPVTGGP
jgi:hypothetical protein